MAQFGFKLKQKLRVLLTNRNTLWIQCNIKFVKIRQLLRYIDVETKLKVFHCMTLRQTDVRGWTSLCRLGFTDIFAATFDENFVEWCTAIIRFLLDTLIVTLKRIEMCRVNCTQFDSITVVRTTHRHVVSPDKHGNGPTHMECNCRRTGLEVIRMNHAQYIILRLLLVDFIFSNFIQN
jgi:hypothetical protein